MGFRKIGAIVLIMGTLLVVFRQYFALLIAIFIVGVILYFVIRLLADLFWWGKDRGRW